MESPTIVAPRSEDENVTLWRFKCLEGAGIPYRQAFVLADHHEVDLHKAVELAQASCPPELLLEILL